MEWEGDAKRKSYYKIAIGCKKRIMPTGFTYKETINIIVHVLKKSLPGVSNNDINFEISYTTLLQS